MDARGRSVGWRFGCPPEGGGYVVPGLAIPVGYCRQNNRCRRSSPKASAQPYRRHRVAPSKMRESPNTVELNSRGSQRAGKIYHLKTPTAAITWVGQLG